ncbi:hypothetical protein Shyhy01_70760 [Streptomyces hygroscopicus subsp. hygroscopicus]|nr:hypothetical protein Shyhy01_70760 [Streptomyces hygroscopicus subsp. hygroscopicus]
MPDLLAERRALLRARGDIERMLGGGRGSSRSARWRRRSRGSRWVDRRVAARGG